MQKGKEFSDRKRGRDKISVDEREWPFWSGIELIPGQYIKRLLSMEKPKNVYISI